MGAIPTGSLAPDSPSSNVPVRPDISRPPSTENTTAESVGDNAAPISNAVRQSKPNSACEIRASATAVTTALATPIHTMAPAAERNRRKPMYMPP